VRDPKAGDFKPTQRGERSVIVVRDNAGAVRRGQVRSKSVNDTCAAAQAGQHHQLIRLRPGIRQYPYMDAPGLPSFQFMTAGREDCTRTSGLSLRHKPLSLMGFAGWLLNRFLALEVLRALWASPTPV
jgi:hypothetical protein